MNVVRRRRGNAVYVTSVAFVRSDGEPSLVPLALVSKDPGTTTMVWLLLERVIPPLPLPVEADVVAAAEAVMPPKPPVPPESRELTTTPSQPRRLTASCTLPTSSHAPFTIHTRSSCGGVVEIRVGDRVRVGVRVRVRVRGGVNYIVPDKRRTKEG